MLVFAKNALMHIFTDPDKGVSRIGVTPQWLIETVDEINQYLPDDWRMTRRVNRFAIKIIGETPDNQPMLVGHTYRSKYEQMSILHIIDTVFPKDFVLKESDKDDRKISLAHPHERYTPNLYYFKKTPEGFKSPLFARQYEKVMIKGKKLKKCALCKDAYYGYEYDPIEYHRIHPLSKDGLDLHHYLWIKYDFSKKTVEIVSTTSDKYHGKDFWIAPYIEEEQVRSNNFDDYIKYYQSLLSKFNVSPVKNKLSQSTAYETELKLLLSEDKFKEIEAFLDKNIKNLGLSIIQKIAPQKAHLDTYLDDDNFSLYKNAISLRIREHRENLRLSFKRRLKPNGNTKEGFYERIEEESPITKNQREKLINGKALNNLPFRLIQYFVPQCAMLIPKLQIETLRHILLIEDTGHQKAEIAFDKVRYIANGLNANFYYEIEIEGRGLDYESLYSVFNLIKDNFPAQPSFQSKYERGVFLLKNV